MTGHVQVQHKAAALALEEGGREAERRALSMAEALQDSKHDKEALQLRLAALQQVVHV